MPVVTINLPTDIHLRIRNLADRTGRSLDTVIVELLRDALDRGPGGQPFALVAAGEADVDDLAINAEQYLADGLG
jgi:predicted transcriptional regulator